MQAVPTPYFKGCGRPHLVALDLIRSDSAVLQAGHVYDEEEFTD